MSHRLRPRAVQVELSVPFHDVDAMQIVWHGHYLKYLELARTSLMRSRGLDVDAIVGAGFAMVVQEVRLRHSHPLRYGDLVRVHAWCGAIDHRVQICYEVWNVSAGRRAARATTWLATTDLLGNLQVTTPEFIARALTFENP